jgi:hypothetical protein
MSYIPGQQLGDNADILLSNIDGDEGVSKGNLIFGKNLSNKAEAVDIENGAISMHDMRMHSLVEEMLTEIRKVSRYLEIITEEELIDGDFDKND